MLVDFLVETDIEVLPLGMRLAVIVFEWLHDPVILADEFADLKRVSNFVCVRILWSIVVSIQLQVIVELFGDCLKPFECPLQIFVECGDTCSLADLDYDGLKALSEDLVDLKICFSIELEQTRDAS